MGLRRSVWRNFICVLSAVSALACVTKAQQTYLASLGSPTSFTGTFYGSCDVYGGGDGLDIVGQIYFAGSVPPYELYSGWNYFNVFDPTSFKIGGNWQEASSTYDL